MIIMGREVWGGREGERYGGGEGGEEEKKEFLGGCF